MYYPKISIITPSFNQGKYIEQTILSVVEQGYPNYELIIIDGGSTDSTIEILRKYDSKISYWVSEPDKGQAHAINKGLKIASGEIINWINSDDYLEPGALLTIGKFFLENPDKNVLCGYTRCFYEQDSTTSHIYKMGLRGSATESILNLEMNQPGTFYRTSILKELGGINESLRYVFDNELWIRYLGKYGSAEIGETEFLLAQFRLHHTSKSVGEGFDKFNLEQNAISFALARVLCLPDAILHEMELEERASYYEEKLFNIGELSAKEFTTFYFLKYLSKWYHQNHKAKAKEALLYILKGNPLLYPFDRKHISILLRLLFNLKYF